MVRSNTSTTIYPTRALTCWAKAKELRQQYYLDYARAKERGGLSWMGSAWAFDAVPAGLGRDVFCLTGEPYGAACAWNKPLSLSFMKASAKFGFSRDLCAYMRNYLGSILTDTYAFGGSFPKPDFAWTQHICCSHGKWYQNAAQLDGGVPVYVVDVGAGAAPPFEPELYDHRIAYVADQLLDGIDWLEKTTGRTFNDDLFIEAAWNNFRTTHTWAKICMLNRSRPAPLDEKTIYSFYVLATLNKSSAQVADFFEEVYDEVKDRVDKGIAAVANETKRVMSDSQPPWGSLSLYRDMETLGVVSIGSLYSFALEGAWVYEADTHDFLPMALPPKKPATRKEACSMLARWHLAKPLYQHFYSPEYKTLMMDAIAKHWAVDGIILHFNRGCAGLSLGIAENRLGLEKRGNRVMAFQGNMGDTSEFDEFNTRNQMDEFMKSLGCSPSGESWEQQDFLKRQYNH